MKTNYNGAIGEWLMNERIKQGLSQQDIAERLGTTRTAVHYWESGKRTIYADNLISYCLALNVSPSKLMDDIMNDK